MVSTPIKRAATTDIGERPTKKHAPLSPEEGELDDLNASPSAAAPQPPQQDRKPTKVAFPFKKKTLDSGKPPTVSVSTSASLLEHAPAPPAENKQPPVIYERPDEDTRRIQGRHSDQRQPWQPPTSSRSKPSWGTMRLGNHSIDGSYRPDNTNSHSSFDQRRRSLSPLGNSRSATPSPSSSHNYKHRLPARPSSPSSPRPRPGDSYRPPRSPSASTDRYGEPDTRGHPPSPGPHAGRRRSPEAFERSYVPGGPPPPAAVSRLSTRIGLPPVHPDAPVFSPPRRDYGVDRIRDAAMRGEGDGAPSGGGGEWWPRDYRSRDHGRGDSWRPRDDGRRDWDRDRDRDRGRGPSNGDRYYRPAASPHSRGHYDARDDRDRYRVSRDRDRDRERDRDRDRDRDRERERERDERMDASSYQPMSPPAYKPASPARSYISRHSRQSRSPQPRQTQQRGTRTPSPPPRSASPRPSGASPAAGPAPVPPVDSVEAPPPPPPDAPPPMPPPDARLAPQSRPPFPYSKQSWTRPPPPPAPKDIHTPPSMALPDPKKGEAGAKDATQDRNADAATSAKGKDDAEDRKPQAPVVRKRVPVKRTPKQEEEAYGRVFKGCGRQSDYVLTTKLGEGTFGEVHKAFHSTTGQHVALKRILMHNEKEGMPVTALREIKILKALKHDCIVEILDMFVVRSTAKDPLSVYMVFPYMDHDLAGLLENERVKLQPSHIKLYMKQLLEGTAYMHRNHILHRDMKAANLLISNTGSLRIGDFGLARAYTPTEHGDRSGPGSSKDGSSSSSGGGRKYTNCVVTRWYRPPELLLGARQYGGEVDIWGIGCVLGEMFMRRPILPGTSDVDQLEKIWQLCGTPNQHTWPNYDELPGCEGVKRFNTTYGKKLRAAYETIGPDTCDLLDKLLTCNPRERITAAQALDHDYFWSDPLPADPKTLPSYEASHEFTKRSRRPMQPPQPPIGHMPPGPMHDGQFRQFPPGPMPMPPMQMGGGPMQMGGGPMPPMPPMPMHRGPYGPPPMGYPNPQQLQHQHQHGHGRGGHYGVPPGHGPPMHMGHMGGPGPMGGGPGQGPRPQGHINPYGPPGPGGRGGRGGGGGGYGGYGGPPPLQNQGGGGGGGRFPPRGPPGGGPGMMGGPPQPARWERGGHGPPPPPGYGYGNGPGAGPALAAGLPAKPPAPLGLGMPPGEGGGGGGGRGPRGGVGSGDGPGGGRRDIPASADAGGSDELPYS